MFDLGIPEIPCNTLNYDRVSVHSPYQNQSISISESIICVMKILKTKLGKPLASCPSIRLKGLVGSLISQNYSLCLDWDYLRDQVNIILFLKYICFLKII